MSLWRKSEEIAGFLEKGTNVTGELQFSNTLRIDGDFQGSITSNDTLIIGEDAVVHADIKVGNLEVHGQVFGHVEVQRRTEIFSTGRVSGDLQTGILITQAGAILDARSRMCDGSAGGSPVVTVQEVTQVVEPAHDKSKSSTPK
jgi:cytoskeletal protein CcmA (bactofilin family)